MAINDTAKRQANAVNAVNAVRQLLQAINMLQDLANERAKFVNPFVDADFSAMPAIQHMNAAAIGALYDFVVNGASGVQTWLTDAGNGNRNLQTIEQIR